MSPSTSLERGSRLRDAVLDHGAAGVDAVCNTVASRFPETSRRLSRLGGAVTSGAALQDLALYDMSAASITDFTLGNVRALGRGLLERTDARWGLRERTGAILELLLPTVDTWTREEEADSDRDDDGAALGALCVPRALTTHVLQTFQVQLSRTATLHVSVLCLRDACRSTFHRLCRSNFWAVLAEAHLSQLRELRLRRAGDSAAIASRACRLVHSLGERVPGGWLAERVLGGLATVLSSAYTTGIGKDASSGKVVSASDSCSASDVQAWEDSQAAKASTQQFQLVVKNSFIEFLEDEPAGLRRSQSADILDRPSARVGFSEPFTLVVNCLDQAGTAQSVESGQHPPAAETLAERDGSNRGIQPSPCEDQLASGNTVGSGSAAQEEGIDMGESRTTVMLRNVPIGCTRAMLLATLDRHGFSGKYTFIYLPVDFTRGMGLGYALVSMALSADAQRFLALAPEICNWGLPNESSCEACWSEPRQDLAEHIERYRNSPVMHPSVPDDYKPVLFANGVPVDFPPPTKAIRPPRIRHLKPSA